MQVYGQNTLKCVENLSCNTKLFVIWWSKSLQVSSSDQGFNIKTILISAYSKSHFHPRTLKYKQDFPAFFFEIHDMNKPGNWAKGMLLQVHVIKFKRAWENKDAIQRQAVPVYIETRRGISMEK